MAGPGGASAPSVPSGLLSLQGLVCGCRYPLLTWNPVLNDNVDTKLVCGRTGVEGSEKPGTSDKAGNGWGTLGWADAGNLLATRDVYHVTT